MASDDWVPHHNGMVKGTIGVFPALFGAWEVLEKVNGEWDAFKPALYSLKEIKDHDPNRSPPYIFTTRTRDEVIAEAKRLADEYVANKPK